MPFDVTIPGWMGEANLRAIERLAGRVPTLGCIVEVGSFCGRSATAWALSAPNARVHCIDTWELNFENLPPDTLRRLPGDKSRWRGSAERTFREVVFSLENVVPLKGRSTDDWDIPRANLVFLDGDHSERAVSSDLEAWSRRLAEHGLLCGDDFRTEPAWISVVRAVTDFARTRKLHLHVLAGTTIWLLFNDLEHMNRWLG
jgi:predicted O-methyltransferase YrrM